jgi:alpha-1,6-mannosyltransferase
MPSLVNPAPTRNLLGIGALCGAALPLSIYLSIALTILGLDKFHYVLAGGKRFATFANASTHLGISLSYLFLVLLHLIWLLGTPYSYRPAHFRDVLKRVAIFLLLAWVAYPLGNDIYLYLHFGLMNLSDVDPFTTPAGEFVSGLTPFVDWKQTSTYGPISQLLFSISAAAIALHPLLAVYLFKTLCAIAHLFNGYLIWKILPPLQRGKITTAYLLCPLLLLEQVGSAHVDVFLNTWVLVMAVCLVKQRYATAVLALWGGFLTKTLPIIWMPLLGLFLIRQQRWKPLAIALLFSLLIVTALSLTMLPSLQSWRSLLNPGVVGQYQSSLPALLRASFETLQIFVPGFLPLTEQKQVLLKVARYGLLVFVPFYAWTVLQIFRKPTYSALNLMEAIGWVTLVLMLYGTSWLMPWYVSVLLAIAAVIPTAQVFGFTTLMFMVSSSAMYGLQADAGLRSLVTLGLPTLALMIGFRIKARGEGRGATGEAGRAKVGDRPSY